MNSEAIHNIVDGSMVRFSNLNPILHSCNLSNLFFSSEKKTLSDEDMQEIL